MTTKPTAVTVIPADKQAVVVTTEHRGVFFGYVEPSVINSSAAVSTLVLFQARNCLYWSADVKGFLGLASTGPSKSCRVGPAVPQLKLAKVTSIAAVTPEAAQKWEQGSWA